MYFVVLSTELIRWTQAASGAVGRANVGHRLHPGPILKKFRGAQFQKFMYDVMH